MTNVVILGAGLAGSALSVPLAEHGHRVHLVGARRDDAIVDAITANGFHPRLETNLPKSVTAHRSTQLATVLAEGVDLLVLAVSTPGVPWAIDQLASALQVPTQILMLTKGLACAGDEIETLSAMIEAGLAERGAPAARVGGIGGPCIAGELAAGRDTSAVVAFPDEVVLADLIDLLRGPSYHPHPSTDVVGVEACAALKNLLALGVAAATQDPDGALPRHSELCNPPAALFTQALAELGHMVRALGGRPETVQGLAGVGDLYVTCEGGRNGRMGRLLGQGLRYSEAKATHMPEETIEGAELALQVGPVILRWCETGRLQPATVPLTRALIDAICHDRPLVIPWAQCHRAL